MSTFPREIADVFAEGRLERGIQMAQQANLAPGDVLAAWAESPTESWRGANWADVRDAFGLERMGDSLQALRTLEREHGPVLRREYSPSLTQTLGAHVSRPRARS